MQNNAHGLGKELITLIEEPEIMRFYRALCSFQIKIIQFVGNATTKVEAERRASAATEGMSALLEKLLTDAKDIAIANANAVYADRNSSTNAKQVASDAARQVSAGLATLQKCQPPLVWDPVTETCV